MAKVVRWCLLALLGCRSPTQITFVVTTDVPCDQHGGTVISIGHLGDLETRPITSSSSECTDGHVGAVVVVPSGDRNEEVALQVVLGIGKSGEKCLEDKFLGGCITARRALRYIAHEPLVVNVMLRNKCRDVVCPTGTTCVEGDCVDATISDPGGCVGAGCGEGALGDAGADGASDGATDAAGEAKPGEKRVFVTAGTFNAALGGASGADAKCQAAAAAASLGGTFRAWVSDASSSPSTRFTRSGPYVLLDGTLVANDWADLTKGSLRHAIDLTEARGKPPTGTFCKSAGVTTGALTGTTTSGTRNSQDSCGGFTNGAFATVSQMVFGVPAASNADWTSPACLGAGPGFCNLKASLYCFEQ